MPTRAIATSIVQKLQAAGYIAYFTGGWVRDFLMEQPSDDIDIATNASIETIQTLFPKTIPVGISFGIIIVVEEGHPFEVALFRKDREYKDGRRPIGFDPSTPEEDAQRRDFTINGMFYDPITNKLYDFIQGQKDIEAKVIRAIGNPHERLLEDRLRMMRAVRYSTRFNFPIEKNTIQAILAHTSELLPAVAIERIWQEFKKMSKFAHFDRGLILLHELNLLPTIFPILKEISLEEIQKRVQYIEFFPHPRVTILELLELFPDSSLQEKLALCAYLKLSKEECQWVTLYHKAASLFDLFQISPNNIELIEWAKLYSQSETQLYLEIYALHLFTDRRIQFLNQQALIQKRLEKPILRMRTQTPLLSATDLLQLNIPPGKEMGILLKEAERLSVNLEIEDKNTLIDLLHLRN